MNIDVADVLMLNPQWALNGCDVRNKGPDSYWPGQMMQTAVGYLLGGSIKIPARCSDGEPLKIKHNYMCRPLVVFGDKFTP